jgi:hypothetical protein
MSLDCRNAKRIAETQSHLEAAQMNDAADMSTFGQIGSLRKLTIKGFKAGQTSGALSPRMKEPAKLRFCADKNHEMDFSHCAHRGPVLLEPRRRLCNDAAVRHLH